MDEATRRGFTLIEFLVVIAIIGILAALIAVTTASIREDARKKKILTFAAQVDHILIADCVLIFDFDEAIPTDDEPQPTPNVTERCQGSDQSFVLINLPTVVQGVDKKSALQFTATTSPLLIHDLGADVFGDYYAVQVWVRPSGPLDSQTRYIVNAGATNNFSMTVTNDDVEVHAEGDTSSLDLQAADVLKVDKWTHLLATFAPGPDSRLYVDGEMKDSASVAVNLAGGIILVGGATDLGDPATNFLGSIDNVRFYTEPLPLPDV